MIRAAIIEDEYDCCALLKEMIENHCQELKVVGTAATVPQGIELIKTSQPDLIFLDIDISEGKGFDILDAVQSTDFKVIFVTGYEAYAFKAIKYAALDYLLKPIILDELKQAIEKAKKWKPAPNEYIFFIKETLNKPSSETDQVVLTDHKNHNIVNVEDIIYVEAQRSYTLFHFESKQNIIACNSLHHFEQLLPRHKFYRIHKSFIVNCDKVVSLETGRGGQVKMLDGQLLPIAFRRKAAFLRFFGRVSTLS